MSFAVDKLQLVIDEYRGLLGMELKHILRTDLSPPLQSGNPTVFHMIMCNKGIRTLKTMNFIEKPI